MGRIRIDIRSVWMKDMIRTGKIICHGYEECLTSLYEICDVYLNPMRAGGGWSVAWAIMKGVLVATTKGINPGNAWIGEKKAIEGNYQDLLEYIDKLDKDRNFYKEEKQYILERSLQLSFDNSVRAIVEEIQKIRI